MAVPKKPFSGSQFVLSLGLIIVSAAYALWQQVAGQPPASSPSQQFKNANDAFLQTPSQPPLTRGLYADGSYAGTPADAYYGTVQVKVVVQGGRIADVQFMQYPSDRSTSRYINGQAMPILTQEAIQAQSAQVNGVSGATFTSQAFQQSLASAVAQASTGGGPAFGGKN